MVYNFLLFIFLFTPTFVFNLRTTPNIINIRLGDIPSHHILQNNISDPNFTYWERATNTGLDMRHGIDLAEVSPFYNSDGNVSIDKLHYFQMCQRLLKTLECDSKSIYTKLALIDYFFFLFPLGKESINYYGNDVTDIRLLEGGLLDDWDFDEFDISDF